MGDRLYQKIIRPLAFHLSPERAHNIAIALISRGLIRAGQVNDPRLHQTFFGKNFTNPLGLAAGFDKNGVAINRWSGLGFGFAEVGTVTYHAQPGNPQPRLFRLSEDRALINRMGFNNAGASSLAVRIRASRASIPIGINLGKSKITPVEQAADDYRASFELLSSFGDYFVVNVSSPNTPGLRSLQDRGPLLEIIRMIRTVANRPLFVKIAPDLSDEAVDEVADLVNSERIDGVVATNTTLSREGLRSPLKKESGGLSGSPLKQRSNEVIVRLANTLDKDRIIIGVGGIENGDDLFQKLAFGATLAQIYTGWIYRGPSAIPAILRELLTRMDLESVRDLNAIKRR